MNWKIGTSLVVGVAVVSVGLSLFVTGYWSTEIFESTGTVAAVSESEGDGLHEGIKVRGEYEIEVRDPDGTLVARRVFSNTVTSAGKHQIAQAMRGIAGRFDTWNVSLVGNPLGPCAAGGSNCMLREGNTTYTEHSIVQSSLSVSGGSGLVILEGAYIAGDPPGPDTGGTITTLESHFGTPPMPSNLFSYATVSPVPWTKGQIINVTYQIRVN